MAAAAPHRQREVLSLQLQRLLPPAAAAWRQHLQLFNTRRSAVLNDPSLSNAQRQDALARLRQQALAELENPHHAP